MQSVEKSLVLDADTASKRAFGLFTWRTIGRKRFGGRERSLEEGEGEGEDGEGVLGEEGEGEGEGVRAIFCVNGVSWAEDMRRAEREAKTLPGGGGEDPVEAPTPSDFFSYPFERDELSRKPRSQKSDKMCHTNHFMAVVNNRPCVLQFVGCLRSSHLPLSRFRCARNGHIAVDPPLFTTARREREKEVRAERAEKRKRNQKRSKGKEECERGKEKCAGG